MSRSTQPLRVLLVDDDELFRESAGILLALEGRLEIVGVAGDGEEAVESAREIRPDVVLIDVEMPLLDGFGACRRIRMALPETAVVVWSALDEPSHRERAKQAGAVAYFSKTQLAGDFAASVAELARRPR